MPLSYLISSLLVACYLAKSLTQFSYVNVQKNHSSGFKCMVPPPSTPGTSNVIVTDRHYECVLFMSILLDSDAWPLLWQTLTQKVFMALSILSVCAFTDPHPLHLILYILQHIGSLAESWWVDFWASVSVILLNLTLHWKAALLLFH